MHLPLPRILDGKRDRLAGAVALVREHDLFAPVSVAGRQQDCRAGLHPANRVDRGECRQRRPALRRRLLGGAHLRGDVRLSKPRGPHLQRGEVGVGRPGRIEVHRERLGDRRAGVSAFREREPSAERQQAAAAQADEVGHHPQLVRGERARLDAAEHDGAVGVQLLARLREPAGEVVGGVDVEPQELALGRSLQRHHLQVLVVGDGLSQELHLGPGLAVDVENPLAPIDDGDQRVALVVLRHLFAVEHRDPEVQHARPGVRQREADPHGGRLPVRRQRDVLRRELLAFVLHDERHDAARIAGLADHEVHDEGGALQHRHRRIDATQLDIVRERVAAEPDREHRQAGRSQGTECLGHARARRVGAVAQQHDARDRESRQFLGGPRERLGDVRTRARVGAALRARDAFGGGREAEVPKGEAARERGAEPPRVAEGVTDERGARRRLVVRDRHAARVVHEHGEEVALRLDGAEHQHRPEQADENDADRGKAQAEEDQAGGRRCPGNRTAEVGPDRDERGREGRQHGERRRPGRAERQISLGEDHGPELERQAEQPARARTPRAESAANSYHPIPPGPSSRLP